MITRRESMSRFSALMFCVMPLTCLLSKNFVGAFSHLDTPQNFLSKRTPNTFYIINKSFMRAGKKSSLSIISHKDKVNQIQKAMKSENEENEENDDGNKSSEVENKSDSAEQIILRLSLSVINPQLHQNALEKTTAYIQSFPFAAVLPVQPLTYVPSEDGSGVKVTFLRKKTKEKGSIDGGVDIAVRLTKSKAAAESYKIKIEAKRNSEGQTISKTFSEMLIVKALLRGINGEDPERCSTELSELVSIDSFFHQWMQ